MRDMVFACIAIAVFLPDPIWAQDKTAGLQLGKNDRLIDSGGPGIAGIAFSPDERWLAYAGDGKAVNIQDRVTHKQKQEP